MLKEILKSEAISQAEFAKSINTTQGTVSKWLNGVQEPRFYQLQLIAKTYDYSAEFILGIN